MNNLSLIEDYFQSYKQNLLHLLPEDIITVDLSILQHFGLLDDECNKPYKNPSLSQQFQIIESESKMTLINSQFLIWITSEKIEKIAGTWTLIALNGNPPHLELAFVASGIYNHSRLVLRILERFLSEIEENEQVIQLLKK